MKTRKNDGKTIKTSIDRKRLKVEKKIIKIMKKL